MGHHIDLESQEFVYIGKNSVLKGSLELYGPATFCSKIQANLRSLDDSTIQFERESIFEGTVHGHDILIYGNFNGEIISSGKVSLYPTAVFQGKITCKNLNIHPGAQVNMQASSEESLA